VLLLEEILSRQPWLLATSLSKPTPKKITDIYAKRFQIEECFRDAKNPRFGWSFRHARSRSNNRLEILLLIATLGILALTLVGQAAELHNMHKGFQANTVRKMRVLSLFFLGKNVIEVGRDKTLLVRDYLSSIENLREKAACL
jgi:DDE family transposase